jgi:N-acetylglucosaminyldiphosphoundecaprenol N-acetyl-beta-D-mannosaminyltransferase
LELFVVFLDFCIDFVFFNQNPANHVKETTMRKIRERLSREQPAIRAGSFSPPYKTLFNDDDNVSLIKVVNEFSPDVLFMGMTAPKQEKWVYQNRHLINSPVICSIGAVFDFYAGTVKRPGKFWISIGLE